MGKVGMSFEVTLCAVSTKYLFCIWLWDFTTAVSLVLFLLWWLPFTHVIVGFWDCGSAVLCFVLAGIVQIDWSHYPNRSLSGGSTPGGDRGPPEFSVTSGLLSGLDFLSPVLALITLSFVMGWAAWWLIGHQLAGSWCSRSSRWPGVATWFSHYSQFA